MRELAIAQGIVEKVHEAAAGPTLRALAFSLDLVGAGSAAQGSMLDIRSVAGTALNLKSMAIEEAA